MTGTMAKVKAFSAVTDSEMKVFESVFIQFFVLVSFKHKIYLFSYLSISFLG